MAYGSPEAVAAFASTWTDNGEWKDPDLYGDGATNPTLEQVEEWLDEVSVLMDLALAGEGFTVPVTHVSAVKALGLKVSALVADLVHLVHDKGRLFSDRLQETGTNPTSLIERDISSWVTRRVNAFEAFGIPRKIDYPIGGAYSVPAARQT